MVPKIVTIRLWLLAVFACIWAFYGLQVSFNIVLFCFTIVTVALLVLGKR